MKKKDIPVFLVNQGFQPWLKYSIEQAIKYDNYVILLGDQENKNFGNEWYPISDYISMDNQKFQTIYKHMSSNPEQFELICFLRFFLIYEFMIKHNLEKCVYIDSDVLSYVDYQAYYKAYPCKAALAMVKADDGNLYMSGYSSFWTIDYLRDFLNFMLDMYENHLGKLEEIFTDMRKSGETVGGICDMTLLTLWARGKKEIRNTVEATNGSVFDFNINSATNYKQNEYRMSSMLKIKKIIYKDRGPFFEKKNGQHIKVNCIHFQGGAKNMMKGFIYHNRFLILKGRIYFLFKENIKRFIYKMKF